MPSVRVRENEYFDAALRRFKRACEKAGVLAELRRRDPERPPQIDLRLLDKRIPTIAAAFARTRPTSASVATQDHFTPEIIPSGRDWRQRRSTAVALTHASEPPAALHQILRAARPPAPARQLIAVKLVRR